MANDPPHDSSRQRDLYDQAVAGFGAALERLARAYEREAERREDLVQEIHLNLWRSFERFDGRCSLRTWVYRVAHNVAATHVLVDRRRGAERLVALDDLPDLPGGNDTEAGVDARLALEELHRLLARLRPPDRQLMLLHLEGLDAASMSEITGYSPANVATKLHRIRKILATLANAGGGAQ